MSQNDVILVNCSGGELSKKLFGRNDLPIYKSGAQRCLNFITEQQGNSKYRSGFRQVRHTRLNQVANIIKFEYNDEQSYQVEFTHKKIRFYKDRAIITETAKAITSISQANPGVVGIAGHGWNNGDEIFISAVNGMEEVNSRWYLIANKTANDFQLTDWDGNPVDTSVYTAYSSGGTAARVYEIDSPYDEDLDLFLLRLEQSADTAYIVHPYYEPRKLTRTGHTAWTLSRYTRTADKFLTGGTGKTIVDITNANPGVVEITAHGWADGTIIFMEDIAGMTEANSTPYVVKNPTTDHFELYDLDGNPVNTTGFGAYSSGGYASEQSLLPSCHAFYEAALYFAGFFGFPDKLIGSRKPDNNGNPRYDDFTTGTDPDHAVEYTIGTDGEVNVIIWLKGTDRLLFAGTYGAESKVTGETDDKPITPTSVNTRAVSRRGVANVPPINKDNSVIYVQRGQKRVRAFEFDALRDGYVSIDRNLVSDHIIISGIKQMAWQSGQPDILWMIRNDGVLLGNTYKSGDDVSGWHRHYVNNAEDKVISISPMPRDIGYEELWAVIECEIEGETRRYVEYMEDEALLPERKDYLSDTDEVSKAADEARYLRAMREAMKSCLYLDHALTYDGSVYGSQAGATLTMSAVTGSGVVATASAPVFKASFVGRELWKKAIDGNGTGRATITGYTDSTHVTVEVTEDFDSLAVMAAGDWYLTAQIVGTLGHLEGRTVGVVADGGLAPEAEVQNAQVDIGSQASVIHIGTVYPGLYIPMPLEAASASGGSYIGRNKNIYEVGIRFLDTMGAEFGTDLYKPEQIPFSAMPVPIGNPDVPFTGMKRIPYSDNWEENKFLYIRQRNPLPCTIQLIAAFLEGED